MRNRHIAIFGASRGLGKSAALHFARLGWAVSIAARSQKLLSQNTDSIRQAGAQAFAQMVDVTDESSVVSFYEKSHEEFGPIDAILNCAGRYGPFGKLEDSDSLSWRENVEVNLFGNYSILKNSLKYLNPEGAGIVVLSGGGATQPLPGISAYAASKSAIVRLVETFALEVQYRNIAVNALAPGLLATDMLDEILSAPEEAIDPLFRKKMEDAKAQGGDSMVDALECTQFLLSQKIPGLTGRLVSAKWDAWRSWDQETSFTSKDIFTLRRHTDIV